jgi:hypothetical protein
MTQSSLPNYHFLLIASNLGAEWLFDAARTYWERFMPTVISDVELLRLLPKTRTVVVTILARRDRIAYISAQLAQYVPQATLDPVAYDYFDDAKLTLDGRASLDQPFGVPLPVTPTLLPPPTLTPTPGVPTRAPGGFVTQTPTPDKGG